MSEPTKPSGSSVPDPRELAAAFRKQCAALDDFAPWGLNGRPRLRLDPFRAVPGLAAALSGFASRQSQRRLTPDGIDEVLIRFRVWLLKPKTAQTLAKSIVHGMERGVPLEAAACKRFQDELRRMASRNTLSVLPRCSLDALVGTKREPRCFGDESTAVIHAA